MKIKTKKPKKRHKKHIYRDKHIWHTQKSPKTQNQKL